MPDRSFHDTHTTPLVKQGIMEDKPMQVHAGYMHITDLAISSLSPLQLQEFIDQEAQRLAADLFAHVMKVKYGKEDEGIFDDP